MNGLKKIIHIIKVRIPGQSSRSMFIDNRGFSLVEVMLVLTILVILLSISTVLFNGYIAKSKMQICKVNCTQISRMYEIYLLMESKEYSEESFAQYLQAYGGNICPSEGVISYNDGKISCALHFKEDTKETKEEHEICSENCKILEEDYQHFLLIESQEHTDDLFNQYMQDYKETRNGGEDLCPSLGTINFINGNVICNLHSGDVDEVEEEDENEDVDDFQVCLNNRIEAEEEYQLYLIQESQVHNEAIFSKFINERGRGVCPSGGVISFRVIFHVIYILMIMRVGESRFCN